MATTRTKRWTITDLEDFPQPWDDTRYEIIDGELYVSSQPSDGHQYTCTRTAVALTMWNDTGSPGSPGSRGIVLIAPGLIFAEDDNAAPDVIWVSHERYQREVGPDGKLHGPPELVVEVLSPGHENERRDLVTKLALYSRRGVDEYWILDWCQRRALIHRRAGNTLELAATLDAADRLESPLLPGFSCRVKDLLPPATWPVPETPRSARH